MVIKMEEEFCRTDSISYPDKSYDLLLETKAEVVRKLKEITTTFQKLIECPICLEPLKIPFVQCATGHNICLGCIEDLEACPTCQAEFTTENPTLVKHFLEAMPQFCCNSESGCEDIVEQGGDHGQFCGFRIVACRETGCGVNVAANQLLKHYETEHPKQYIVKAQGISTLSWPSFNPGTFRAYCCPVFVLGKFFFINLKNDPTNGQLTIKFEIVPVSKQIDDYFLRVKFEKGNLNFTYSLKAYYSQTAGSQLDGTGEMSSDNPDTTCMRVPQELLSHFINDEGKLEFTLFFFKLKK